MDGPFVTFYFVLPPPKFQNLKMPFMDDPKVTGFPIAYPNQFLVPAQLQFSCFNNRKKVAYINYNRIKSLCDTNQHEKNNSVNHKSSKH